MDNHHPYRRLGALAANSHGQPPRPAVVGRRLAALALAAAATLTFSAACTEDSEAPAGNAAAAAAGGPEPKTLEGAKVAAQTVFDRFSGGDFAGAWEMYTSSGKQAISKDDYVKLNTACSRKGLAIQLTSARMEGTDRAVVIAKQLVAAQSYTMVYEADAWRLEPAKEGLTLYKLGADKAIAAQKKAGTCAGG
ncbi:hypothetical protein FHR83_000202 [Actinoplanes campanulatus]|uniref:Uncharacterized protein n=1 Tax=Actinoplanes campanulatus TaxID=113559 RepID=A0A7W5AAB9_9ACTN|nr:hypothetical protein [Actinoplanes campanulatus]MBB3092568.1 hypothetical protein [Actinoplanes campanulatus]GGM97448.1 hypothetical protein GCM10010109_01280 [Actinoplanes campanulatus]GID34337.1 hypothetical protein Aca09nite_08430 [Actinoplanes campanulatus]